MSRRDSMAVDSENDKEDDNEGDTQQNDIEMTVPQPNTHPVTGGSQMSVTNQLASNVIESNRTLTEKLLQSEEQNEEKDNQIKEKDNQIKEKDNQIKELKVVVTRRGVSNRDWNILNFLRDKTANPNETLSWFEPYHIPPFSGRLLLFGTPSPKSFSSLNALLPPVNIFNDIDTRKIRNLLVNACFFNWEQELPSGYQAPGGSSGQVSSHFYYTLKAKVYKTDTSEFDAMLQNDEKFRSSLEPLVSMHRYFSEQYEGEGGVGHEYFHFLKLETDFVNLLQPKDLAIKPIPHKAVQVPSEWRNWFDFKSDNLFPDGYFLKSDGEKGAPYDNKSYPLVSKESMENPDNIENDVVKLDGCLRQLVLYKFTMGSLNGFASDMRNSIFTEFDLDTMEDEMKKPRDPNEPPKLYLKLYFSTAKQIWPSYKQCYGSWLLKVSKGTTEDQKKRIKELAEFYSKTKVQGPNSGGNSGGRPQSMSNLGENAAFQNPQSAQASSSAPTPANLHNYGLPTAPPTAEEKPEQKVSPIPTITKGIVRIGVYPGKFQVYKVKAREVNFFEHNLHPQEHLVLKIFDPKAAVIIVQPSTKVSARDMEIYYDRELECVRRVSQGSKFNSCYFNHNEMWVKIEGFGPLVSGRCLISKYIETVPLPINLETYKKVKDQIDILHDKGICHNDIAARNILYSKQGDVYIIDFDWAIIDPEDKKVYKRDFIMLETVFEECLPKRE